MIAEVIVLVLIAAATAWYFIFSASTPKPMSAAAARSSARFPAAGSEPKVDSTTAASAAPAHDIIVIYGSQTGTAETFAKTLTREGNRLGISCKLQDVEDYQHARRLKDEKLVIFVVATYGEGEPTDSMKPFHDWFKGDELEPNTELKDVKYTVFALGDTGYKHFCQMGVFVDERMAELGGQRVYGLGQGDASKDLEEAFDSWRTDLWPAVGKSLNITLKSDSEEAIEPELKLRHLEGEEPASRPYPPAANVIEPAQRQPAYLPIIYNKDMLKNVTDGRVTRDICLDISGTAISYRGGDHLGILARNSDETVNKYLKVLGISDEQANRVISLADKNGRNQLPAWATLRGALTWYVDLTGVPKKSVLRTFAHYCEDDAQKKDFLSVLRVNDEALARYHKLQSKVRDIFGFLRKYDSCKVPPGHFLEAMPRMQPRWFSIASDQLLTKGAINITVAVVEGGVCTTMLKNMKPGDEVACFVRKSNFQLPYRHKARPVVMVGPGTGVAPLIGFCQRRQAWANKGNELGKCILFFGCRKRDEDFLHRDYLEAMAKDGKVITSLDVAFSREGADKDYVQHHIQKRSQEICDLLLKEKCNIYICGDAKRMAKDVEKCLVEDVLIKCGGMNEDKAKEYLNELEKQDRFMKDVWSA